MDFPPRWLPTLVVFATLATLAYVAISQQWLLVAIVLVLLLMEVFMSGPVELDSGWFRVIGRLERSSADPLPSHPPSTVEDPDSLAPKTPRGDTKEPPA